MVGQLPFNASFLPAQNARAGSVKSGLPDSDFVPVVGCDLRGLPGFGMVPIPENGPIAVKASRTTSVP